MPTLNQTVGGTTGLADNTLRKYALLENEIDYSIAANNAGISDVIQLINVPPGFLVKDVIVKIKVVEGVGTFTVGDGADPNGYILAGDLNAVGYTRNDNTLLEAAPNTFASAYNDGNGKLYSTADTIDLIPSIALTAAKIKIWVGGFMLND